MIGWNDISWNQYLEIMDVFEDNDLSEPDRIVELCKIVYEVNILQLPLTDYNRYITGLGFLNTQPPKMPLMKEYTVNGTTYTVTTDISDFTVAQYFDVDTYIKQGQTPDNYPKIMSVFFIPKGKKYNEGYRTADVIEDMGDLPVPVVLSLSGFFLNFWKQYIKVSLLYLKHKARRMKKRDRMKFLEEVKTMENLTSWVFSD